MENQKANEDTTYCICKECTNKCWRLEFLERSCQNGNKIK